MADTNRESLRREIKAWDALAHPAGPRISSTVEEYTRFLPRIVSDRLETSSVHQEDEPLMIEWPDKNIKNDADAELKAKEDPATGLFHKDRLIYDTETWLVSEIKVYHDLPANPIQIIWPSNHRQIMPIVDSFAPFSRLPTEIRHIIWNYALYCDSRNVKLGIDRKYNVKNASLTGKDEIVLSCHLRQHGPLSLKLPIQLLYVCHESNLLFLKRYKKMNLNVPNKRVDLDLRVVGARRSRIANCEVRIDRKGYTDFSHDTVMISQFRKITGILWEWNHTKLDLSMIKSLALTAECLGLRSRSRFKGEITVWEALETGCPNLERLTIIEGIMENGYLGPIPDAVACLLSISPDFLDEFAYDYCIACKERYSGKTSPNHLRRLRKRFRDGTRDTLAVLRHKYNEAKATRLQHRHQVKSNPDYWRKINFDVALVSWVLSSLYIGKKMENIMVIPPKHLQQSMPDSYFWAQRPIEIAHDEPKLYLPLTWDTTPIPCHPDGSLLNRYEGVKKMLEG